MPRPKLNPTEDQRRMVKTMTAMGAKQEEVAMRIGVRSPKTLRKHFRKELDQGGSEANMTVAQALYNEAKGWRCKSADVLAEVPSGVAGSSRLRSWPGDFAAIHRRSGKEKGITYD